MTAFVESPMPVIFLGIVAEAVLATIFASTRQGVILVAMLGVLVLVFAGVGLEWLVVTDREQVEKALYGAADALETNEWPRIEKYLSQDAVRTRDRAMYNLKLVEITSAKISNLQVEVNRLTSPPTAEARFLGVVHYDSRVERIPYRYYGARFVVELRLENGRWLITDHIVIQEL
jgi:hypothetical protein